jgi:hypothetical protein
MDQRIEFFTIVARNYLAYAYVLGDSVKRYHPEAGFSIFLMDDVINEYSAEIAAKGFGLITPAQIQLPNYRQFVFKYNVTEASTGVKPFVIQRLLDAGADKVIYLDPDILCFRRLDEVIAALDTAAIVLTPHSTSPLSDEYFPDDYLFLASGVYNLGFIAVRNSAVTQRFIAWWRERLTNGCLDLIEKNLFVDQKWIDLVPAYFEDVLILKSLAYNIAYWNLHERRIYQEGDTLYVAPTDEPVAFLHFSGMVVDSTEQISKYGPRSPFSQTKKRYSLQDRPDLVEPFKQYSQLVLAAGLKRYAAIPYAFNTYLNGEKISQMERALYYTSPEWQQSDLNPFAVTANSFWRACRKAGIRQATSSGQQGGTGDLGSNYLFAFKFIQVLLRIVARLLGPEMYAKFAKYMRQQLLLINQEFMLKR